MEVNNNGIIYYFKKDKNENNLMFYERCRIASKFKPTNEKEFKQNKFDTNDNDAVKKALIAIPKLLERPVLIKSNNAVIGRPPENVKTLL